MRVALISLHFSEYATRLALALEASGHSIQLHLSETNASAELDDDLAAASADVIDIRRHPFPARKMAWLHGPRIAGAIRRFKPDIIHSQEAAPWTTLAAVVLAGDAPRVLTVHDPLAHSGADATSRRRGAAARTGLRRSADAIIVHGPSVVADMVAAEPSLAGYIHSVMHGILGDPPSAASRKTDSFLFFGRIEAYKGLGVLLDAVRLLGASSLFPEVIVAGRGGDLDAHRATIAALPNVRLDDRFIPADNVPTLFGEATATVMPYLDATQSGVLAHAFSAGAPVIASRVGGLPDVVEDRRNGLLVPVGDAVALAAAMCRILTEPGLAAALAAGATHTAQTTLAWNEIAGATLGVYEAARGRKRKLLI